MVSELWVQRVDLNRLAEKILQCCNMPATRFSLRPTLQRLIVVALQLSRLDKTKISQTRCELQQRIQTV